MDLTEGTHYEKIHRAKINMMWVAMISMFMTFAGLTSAYIVSNTRADWVSDFQFPTAFYYSLGTVITSSIVFYLVIKFVKKNDLSTVLKLIILNVILGGTFVFLQFSGFEEIVSQGYYPTGSESTIVTSFIYAIVFVHLLHIFGGLIVLCVILFNQIRGKYSSENYLGLKLASMYWHFVDFLWVYLFCFLYFFR